METGWRRRWRHQEVPTAAAKNSLPLHLLADVSTRLSLHMDCGTRQTSVHHPLWHGFGGTRPQIKEENCTHCGICVGACPLPNVIDLKTLKVDYQSCQRCLLCYEACPENAISVKGYSGARQ